MAVLSKKTRSSKYVNIPIQLFARQFTEQIVATTENYAAKSLPDSYNDFIFNPTEKLQWKISIGEFLTLCIWQTKQN